MAIWFQYGVLPDSIDPDYPAARLNEASSLYPYQPQILYT